MIPRIFESVAAMDQEQKKETVDYDAIHKAFREKPITESKTLSRKQAYEMLAMLKNNKAA